MTKNLIVFDYKPSVETEVNTIYQWDTIATIYLLLRDLAEDGSQFALKNMFPQSIGMLQYYQDVFLIDTVLDSEILKQQKASQGIDFHLYSCKLDACTLYENLGGSNFFTTSTVKATSSTCFQFWEYSNCNGQENPPLFIKYINDICMGEFLLEDHAIVARAFSQAIQGHVMNSADDIQPLVTWLENLTKIKNKDFLGYIKTIVN